MLVRRRRDGIQSAENAVILVWIRSVRAYVDCSWYLFVPGGLHHGNISY